MFFMLHVSCCVDDTACHVCVMYPLDFQWSSSLLTQPRTHERDTDRFFTTYHLFPEENAQCHVTLAITLYRWAGQRTHVHGWDGWMRWMDWIIYHCIMCVSCVYPEYQVSLNHVHVH